VQAGQEGCESTAKCTFHADFYFQQRSIQLQRIENVAKCDNGFKSDISFMDHFLASRVMHPHKLVANHGEPARRTERQPHMDRQGRTQNIMDTNCSQNEYFRAGLRP
jgi:hypothetical protein